MENLVFVAPLVMGVLPAVMPRGHAFTTGIGVFVAAQLLLFLYISNKMESPEHFSAAGDLLGPMAAFTPTFWLIPALAVRSLVLWAFSGIEKNYESAKGPDQS